MGRDPFNQNFRKFRSKTQWIGSVQPEKFRKNGSTFWGGPLFPVGPVGILVEWIAPHVTLKTWSTFIYNVRSLVRSRGKRLVLFSTYNNTNLILKTTEWMIFTKSFPYIICICLFLLWDNFKSRCFLAWGFVFVLFCSFTKKEIGSVFHAFCHATFHHAWITCCIVSRAGYIASCITIRIHLILVKATWPRINQCQSLFTWVKV